MGSVGAMQVKDAGHDGTYASIMHNTGQWKTTMISPVIYKMRGFNTSTAQYEFWLANNPRQGPPSGATVTNKTIAAVMKNVFPTEK